MKIKALFIFFIGFLLACETQEKSNKTDLPESIGGTKKILIVANENLWASSIKDSLKGLFSTQYPGLISDESYFSVNRVGANKFNDLYKIQRVIVIPILLNETSRFENILSEEIKEKVKAEKTFVLQKENLWANNQFVFFLVAQNLESFQEQLKVNSQFILNRIDEKLVQGLISDLESKNRSNNLEQFIRDNEMLAIVIPEKYELAKDTTNFIWLRSYRKDADLNLIISSAPYKSQNQFSETGLLQLRDSVCHQVFVDPIDTASYMITETYIRPTISSLQTENGYTQKMNGLWRINNFRLGGGSFISYSFLNPEKTRQFYVEGFVFAPQKEKIQYLRKLDATLKSITFLKK